MMDIELKPCPFCGSSAEVDDHLPYGVTRYYTVGCSNNDCIASWMCGVDFDTKEKAIEAWNRRTP